MADEVLKNDQNRYRVLAGVTNDANLFVSMLRVDPTTKRLLVDTGSTGGGGGVSQVDNSAYVPGTATFTPVGGELNNVTPAALTEGNAGAIRLSANRNQYIQIRDGAGNERGANVTAGGALQTDSSATTQPVSISALPSLAAGSNTIGAVKLVDTAGTNQAVISAAGAQKVDGSAVTQPVSIAATVPVSIAATVPVSVASTLNVTEVAVATTNGMTAFNTNSLLATVVTPKASAGRIYYYHFYNPNSVTIYIQFFDNASPTVGSTTPTRVIAVPALGAIDTAFSSFGQGYATAIKLAATTTPTGSTAPTTALTATIDYI